MAVTLDELLGNFYRDFVLKGIDRVDAAKKISDAIAADSPLLQPAKDKLAELEILEASCNGALASRCYVSHVQKIGLETALS